MDYQQGSTIRGYTIKERIGGGGFGEVYLANQSFRDVAIKVIKPQLANNPEFIRRFEAEAHLIARLEDPFIVPLYDFWRDPNGAYLVMRYLRNGSLHDLIQKQGALEIEETVSIMDQVTQALHVAHQDNVIHRDIKPGNILLDEFNRAYLADFGIAKDYNVTQGATTPDDIVGSPDYMSPEQARSEPVTPRTDIYSLGVVLYEMLAGEHPFPNLTVIERMYKHLNDPLPDISVLDNDIRSAVNAVIQKATAKDPDHRFQDVLAMAQALREAARLDVAGATATIVELLTPREQEVLKFIIEGKSNRQIAEKLVIEISTVKSFVNQIYRKLRVRSRQQAIVKGRELDLIVGRDASPTTGLGSQLPELKNPYKGLRAFEAADALHFFGRERLTKKLISRLEGRGRENRFLAVVGPSGSGKSSVIRAGLIPALYRGSIPGSDQWYVVDMLPGQHPLDELEIALINKVATDRNLNLREQLSRDERGLIRAANLALPDDNSELLLIIDQFEEVFTLVEDERDRLHFLRILEEAVTNNRSRVRVVVALRADYYDRPLQYPDFGELMRSRVETVLPLSVEELEQAVREPAHQVGVHYEDGLVARIVADVNYQPGALPLLQYALTELFERRDGRRLIQEAYAEIGGTGGALANRADEIFLEFSEEAQELTRQMFLRLVTLGEGAEDTRRRTLRSELLDIASDPEMMDEIIDLYASSRLLSLSNDGETRQPTVEVAHEAILREWERLREWLNLNREDIRQERLIAHAAEAWESNSRDISYLLTGARLEPAEIWREITEMVLTPLEREFIQAAIARREAEQQAEAERQAREEAQERRSRTLLRALVAVFALAAVLSGGFGLYANDQRIRAEASEQEALRQASIGLAAQAEKELESAIPERGVLLALVALEEYPYTPRAQAALARTVEEYRPFRILDAGESLSIEIYGAAWSPDGQQIAGSGPTSPNDVVIWDADNGDVVLAANKHDEQCGGPHVVYHLAWAPSGDRIATGGWMRGVGECGIVVWDTTSGKTLLAIPGGEGMGMSLDWSPDGTSLLTGGRDGTATLWNATTGAVLLKLTGHTAVVNDAMWSPDGTRIATASQDGTVRLWDAETGSEQMILTGHVGPVYAIDWSPDSTRLVSGGQDGLPRVWDVESGGPLFVMPGHTDGVGAVDWSVDSRRIASQSLDATVRVWDAKTGGFLFDIRNVAPGWLPGGYVAFSPDGDEILATDIAVQEGRVWVWDASLLVPKLFGHAATQVYGAWSPDGRLIATSSYDGTTLVYDSATGEPLLTLPGGTQFGDWSPDSNRLVVPGSDPNGYLTWVWDARTGEVLLKIPVPEGVLPIVARWSPDGSRIAGTVWGPNSSNPAYIWDADTGEILVVLQPDDTCMQAFPNWSPDSSRIVTGCKFGEPGRNAPARIWDAASGELLMELESEHGHTASTTWSPDGTRIVATYEGGVARIWDVQAAEVVLTFAGHSGEVFTAAWSPDGTLIASRDLNGVVMIWDAKTGQETMNFTVPGGEGSLNWSPDGTHLIATGGFNVPIIKRVWRSTEELSAYAYACCVFRELTPEERVQSGLSER